MTISRYLVDVRSMSFSNFGSNAHRRQVGMQAYNYPIRLLRVDVSWLGAVNGSEPLRVSGSPFGLFGLDVNVGTDLPDDPGGLGGSVEGCQYLNGDSADDSVTRQEYPYFTSYWSAQEIFSPNSMNWLWLPTIGDSHRSFDFQDIGGVQAMAHHVITVTWHIERPEMDDYQLAILMEEEA